MIYCHILLIFFVNFSFSLWADEARKGQKLFEKKDYKEATKAFLNAEIEEPENFQHSYNRGVSQFQEKNYAEAVEAFKKSSLSQDPVLKKKSFFNLGNSLYSKGELESSVKAFDEVLKMNPEDKQAKENKAWVEKQIQKQKQQKKNDKNQENKDNKDQKKDEDKNQQDSENKDQKKDENKEQQNSQNKNQEKQEQKSAQKQEEEDQKEEEKMSPQEQKEQEDQEKDQEKDQKQAPDSDQKEQTQKEISREEIERLLRSIENMQQVYGVPPKIAPPRKKSKKDW